MNNAIYKLHLHQHNNQTCLSLSQNSLQLRKWFGVFASRIFEKVVNKYKQARINQTTVYLQKVQIHNFFTGVTCLYQQALYYYKVEKNLSSIKMPKHYNCIAESILLQIRMNEAHPSHDELLCNFLDVFQNRNYEIFYETIELLVSKQIIQLIKTENNEVFYDKNPEPHDHIYFKKHNKLVDCSEEISSFFKRIKQFKVSNNRRSNIYHINNSLKTLNKFIA